MSVVSQIEGIFTEKLKDYSTEYNVNYRDVEVLLYIEKESSGLAIALYIKKEFVKFLDLQHDILNIKFDFLGKTPQALMFLDFVIGGFASETSSEKNEIQIQFVARSNEDPSVCLALNKNNSFVRWIDLAKELDM